MGIPVLTCKCSICSSASPHNKRWRPSGLLKIEGKQLLIDAGPDFRAQALRFGIDHLDGLLITHTHFDHIGGLDDLRVFYFLQQKSIRSLLSFESYEELKLRFHYLFKEGKCSWLSFDILQKEFGEITFQGIDFSIVSYYQAGMQVTGYRMDHFAYISDIREYDERIVDALKGVEILVLSALRYTPTEVHFSLDEAVDFARKVGAKKTFFTHIAHELDHEEANAKLPSDIRLAYDGLEIQL